MALLQQRERGEGLKKAVIAACVFVTGVTVFNRVTWTPVLIYPLYPGLMVHLLITGGHGGTLTQQRIGFVAELLTNLTVYVAGTLLCAIAWRSLHARASIDS